MQTGSIRVRAISQAQHLCIGTTGSLRGPQGPPGPPGVSPDVTVTPISGGHRVTIRDADGMETFDVMDGSGGHAAIEALTNEELEAMLK